MFNCSIINSASTECQISNRKVKFLLMDRNAPWLISCCKNCPRCVCEWTRHNISKFWPFVPVHSRGQLPINGSISLLVNVQICRRTVLARLFQYCSNVQTGKDYSPNQAQLQLNFTFHFVRMWGSKLREGVNWKKNVFFRALPELWGGGLPMPEFFGPLFRSAFLVNKKSLFLQKCQCIELLTVF